MKYFITSYWQNGASGLRYQERLVQSGSTVKRAKFCTGNCRRSHAVPVLERGSETDPTDQDFLLAVLAEPRLVNAREVGGGSRMEQEHVLDLSIWEEPGWTVQRTVDFRERFHMPARSCRVLRWNGVPVAWKDRSDNFGTNAENPDGVRAARTAIYQAMEMVIAESDA